MITADEGNTPEFSFVFKTAVWLNCAFTFFVIYVKDHTRVPN